MLNQNTVRKSRYMPGLDGLRAISVLAVIAYHLNLSWAPGGFLGVGVFFVLSGYLITDQLVARWQRDRSLDLRSFWLRRARRLLPAMLLMTAVVCAYLALTDRSRLSSLGGDVLSAVTYVNNWWLIFHKVSYFDSFGPPSPFGHYWSLAVEEQFYLLWPLLLAVGLRFVPMRGKLAAFILAGAAASALAMALLYTPGSDPSRVYYGSDTRVFGLLIGAALAVVWPSGRLSENVRRSSRFVLDSLGLVSLAALLYMIGTMQEYDSFVYRGGLVLLSVVSAVLVAALAHPASGIARFLSVKPLRWLGVRSYGIYLWHYPVIALTTPAVDTDGPNVMRMTLQFAASLALAALSWKFVEEPILRGIWPKAAQGVYTWYRRQQSARRHVAALASACLIILLCVSCVGLGSAGERNAAASGSSGEAAAAGIDSSGGGSAHDGGSPSTGGLAGLGGDLTAADPGDAGGISEASGGTGQDGDTAAGSGGQGGTAVAVAKPSGSNAAAGTGGGGSHPAGNAGASAGASGAVGGAGSKPGTSSPSGSNAPSAASQGSSSGKATDAPAPKSGKGITVIGDSVILGVQSALEKIRPGIVVDGKVGRQFTQAFDTIDSHEKNGDLGQIVVLELGTNGTFTEKKLSQMLDTLGDKRQILVVNTRVPRQWQNEVNQMLADAAADRDNVTLVDWFAASKGKDAYFAKDGVHLNSKGAAYYAKMLSDAIDKLDA